MLQKVTTLALLCLCFHLAYGQDDEIEYFIQQTGHTDYIDKAYFLDEDRILTHTRSEVILWDLPSRQQQRRINDIIIDASSLKSDKSVFAFGKYEIRLLNLQNWTVERVIPNNAELEFMSFTDNDSKLVCIDDNGWLTVHDLQSGGSQTRRVEENNDFFKSQISPDKNRLALSYTDSKIVIWNLPELVEEQVIDLAGVDYDGVFTWNNSSDGLYLVTDDNNVGFSQLAGVSDPVSIGKFGEEINALQRAENELLIYEDNGALFRYSEELETDTIPGVDLALDRLGEIVITDAGEDIALYDLKLKQEILSFQYRKLVRDISNVAFSPNEDFLLIQSNDDLILWDMASGKPRTFLSLDDRVRNCDAKVSPNGKTIAVSYDKNIHLINAYDGVVSRVLSGHESEVVEVNFNHDGNFLISASKHQIIQWDLVERSFREIKNAQYLDINSVWYDNNPFCECYWAAYDKMLHRWDLKTGAAKDSMNLESLNLNIDKARFSNSGLYHGVIFSIINAFLFYDITQSGSSHFIGAGVHDFDFSSDDQYLVYGGTNTYDYLARHDNLNDFRLNNRNIKIVDLSSGKEVDSLVGHHYDISSLDLSDDGNYLVSASEAGEVIIWDFVNRAKLLTIFTDGVSEDYIILTPDNLYMGTKGGLDLLLLKDDDGLKSFGQFDAFKNKPHEVLSHFPYYKQSFKTLYQDFYARRIESLSPHEHSLVSRPRVTVENQNSVDRITTKENLVLKLQLTDSNRNLEKLHVLVKGTPLPSKDFDFAGKNINTASLSASIPLSPGPNPIEIYLENDEKVRSKTLELYVYRNEPRPKKSGIHLLSIGVSDYLNEKDLDYAKKDAAEVLSLFKTNQYDFDYTEPRLLKNEEVTFQNVKEAIGQLENVASDDVVVIFFAGHGIMDTALNYYLGTHNIDFNDPAVKGLSIDSLEHFLMKVPSRNKLVFIDACYSGDQTWNGLGVDTVEASDLAQGDLVFRSPSEKGDKANVTFGQATSFMREYFSNLRYSSGATIIASSGGDQKSVESNKWENGAFTNQLIRGLKYAEADENRDGFISVLEIHRYLRTTVPELTNNYQQPLVRDENLQNNFDFWKPLDYEEELKRAISTRDLERFKFLLIYYEEAKVVQSNIVSLFEQAFEARAVKIIEYLSLSDIDVNLKLSDGQSLLYQAVFNDMEEIVSLLLERGADSKVTPDGDFSPLHAAVHSENYEIVELLLKKGAAVDQQDKEGNTPLYIALESNNIELSKLLLISGASLTIANKEGVYPAQRVLEYPLSYSKSINKLLTDFDLSLDRSLNKAMLNSAYRGDFDDFLSKLEAGAEIDAKSDSGWAAIHYATLYNNVEIFDYLLANGAYKEATNGYGQNALMLSIATQNDVLFFKLKESFFTDVDTLLARDPVTGVIDQNILNQSLGWYIAAFRTDKYGKSLFHYACEQGNTTVLQTLLVNDYLNEYKDWGDHNFYTPLMYAVWNEQAEVVELLVEHGVDQSKTNISGRTALEIAREKNYYEIVNLLRHSEVSHEDLFEAIENHDFAEVRRMVNDHSLLDFTFENGHGPLHESVSRADFPITKLLIEAGADVNLRTTNEDDLFGSNEIGSGSTPLHIAVQNGNLKIAELLLESGARVGQRNSFGDTPLHLAASEGFDEIALYLTKLGASVEAFNRMGVTPIAMAADAGDKKLVRSLLQVREDRKARSNSYRINIANSEGYDPALRYAVTEDVEMVRMLIENGYDPNAETNYGLPIEAAIRYSDLKAGDQLEILRLLLQNGAIPTKRDKDGISGLRAADEEGDSIIMRFLQDPEGYYATAKSYTELFDAIKAGDLGKVKRILDRGIDLNKMGNGMYPLHMAIWKTPELIKMLIDAGAAIDVQNAYGSTPFMNAVGRGDLEIIRLFLAQGADVNSAAKAAVEDGDPEVLNLLLENGMRVDSYGLWEKVVEEGDLKTFRLLEGHVSETFLSEIKPQLKSYAIYEGSKLFVDYFEEPETTYSAYIKHHNFIDLVKGEGTLEAIELSFADYQPERFKGQYGYKAIHHAARHRDVSIIRYLIENGADIDAPNDFDETPLHMAAVEGNDEGVSYLLSKGARVDYSDYDSPLMHAIEAKSYKSVSALLKAGSPIIDEHLYSAIAQEKDSDDHPFTDLLLNRMLNEASAKRKWEMINILNRRRYKLSNDNQLSKSLDEVITALTE